MKRIITVILLFLSLFLLANCGKDPSLKLQKELRGGIGDKIAITLELDNAEGGEKLEWKSSDPSVVSLEISADFLTVEVTLLRVGEAEITVTIIGTEISTSCKVIVNDNLSAPIIKIENNKVVWAAVENAQSYLVMIGNQTYSTTKCEYELSTITTTEDINIAVKAVGGGNYSDSQYSNTIAQYANVEERTDDFTLKFLQSYDKSWKLAMTQAHFSESSEYYNYQAALQSSEAFASLAINRNDSTATVDKVAQLCSFINESNNSGSELLAKITDDFFTNKGELASAIDLFCDMYISESTGYEGLLELGETITYEDCLALTNILHSLFKGYKDLEAIFTDEENAILLEGAYQQGNEKYITIKNNAIDVILNNLPEAKDLLTVASALGKASKIIVEALQYSLEQGFAVSNLFFIFQYLTLLDEEPQVMVQCLTVSRLTLNYLKTLDLDDLDKVLPYADDEDMLSFAGIYFAIDAMEYFENDPTVAALLSSQQALSEEETKKVIKETLSTILFSYNQPLVITDSFVEACYQLMMLEPTIADTVKAMLYEDKETFYNSIVSAYNEDGQSDKAVVDIVLDYPYAILNSIDENNSAELRAFIQGLYETAKSLGIDDSTKTIFDSVLYNDDLVDDIAKFILKISKTLAYDISQDDPFKTALGDLLLSGTTVDSAGLEDKKILTLGKELAPHIVKLFSDANINEAEALYHRVMNHIPEASRTPFPRDELVYIQQLATSCSNIDVNSPTDEDLYNIEALFMLLSIFNLHV